VQLEGREEEWQCAANTKRGCGLLQLGTMHSGSLPCTCTTMHGVPGAACLDVIAAAVDGLANHTICTHMF
jgi:hypothetical protein